MSLPKKCFVISLPPQRGYILVTTLIFLLILTLLTVGALEWGMMQLKINHNISLGQENFQAAESALRFAEKKLEQGNVTTMPCFTDKARDVNELTNQSVASWRTMACSQLFYGKTLFYFIEELARLSCDELNPEKAMHSFGLVADVALGQEINKNESITNKDAMIFYRVTSAASEDQSNGFYPVILQSTFAVAAPASPCKSQIKLSLLGRQSWREVESF